MAELALGVVSLTFQVFSGCIQGKLGMILANSVINRL